MDFVIQHKLIQHDKAIILQFKKKKQKHLHGKKSLNQFQEKQTNNYMHLSACKYLYRMLH